MLDTDFEKRREELRSHIEDYLGHHGIVPNSSGMIQCLSGKHLDTRPSMRIKRPDHNGLYCYTCFAHMDIFDVANKLAGKPISGREFITENINYLSTMFGYEPLKVVLTEEQEHELSCERLHRIAMAQFRSNCHFKNAHARGWSTNDEVLMKLGVGTVDNKDSFLQSVAKEFGCHTGKLYDHGLDSRMFGTDKLTFSLFDRKGKPIGFAARDLNFEKIKDKDPSARKYINPAHISQNEEGHWVGNPLYSKNNYVYNAHNAKTADKTILVEGYANVVQCEVAGISGTVAAGGVAINKDKIKSLERAGLKDVVIAFDYDLKARSNRAGQTATLKAISEFREFPDIRLRILNWRRVVDRMLEADPTLESLDVDYFVNKCGPEAMQRLIKEAVHPIEFQLKEMESSGQDKDTFIKEMLCDIAARSSPIEAIGQVKMIAENTGLDNDLLREELKRQVRLRDHDVLKALGKIKDKYEKRLYGNDTISSQIEAYESMASEMKSLDPSKASIRVEQELTWVEQAESQADGTGDRSPFVKTGVEFIDDDLGGGIPLDGKLLMFGGKPQVGKTMLQNRMAGNILNLNNDADIIVFVWTLDDNKETWLYRLTCVVSGLPLYKCQRSSQYVRDPAERELLLKARQKIRKWIQQGKLIIKDAQEGSNVGILEKYIEEIHSKRKCPIVLFFDNFHKTEDAQDRGSLERTAGRIRNLCHKYRVTVIANAELRKTGADQTSKAPKEADLEDLKETGKLHYDADYAVIIDSPMVRMPEQPDDPEFKGKSYLDISNSYWTRAEDPEHLPIVWLKRGKNKIFNLSGQNYKKGYLRFDPIYVRYTTHNPVINRVVDFEVDRKNKL